MDPEIELQPTPSKRWKIATPVIIVVVLLLFTGASWNALQPAGGASSPIVVFEVSSGQGVGEIARNLSTAGLIRSPLVFELFSLVDGAATSLRPGLYQLSASMSGETIVRELHGANGRTTTVTIPEGSNVYQIDKLLSDALVVTREVLRLALPRKARTSKECYFRHLPNF